MSTTVVGTAIISALVLAYKLLKPGDGEVKMKSIEDEDNEEIEKRIVGIEELMERPLDLTSTATVEDEALSLSALREMAARSVRLCVCEGRSGVTSAVIKRCTLCGATACARCAGRPEHDYVDVVFGDEAPEQDELRDLEGRQVVHEPPRLQPREFERVLKRVLPMCVKLDGIKGALKALGESEDDEMAENSDEDEDSKPKKVSKDGSDASKRNIVRRALQSIKDVELRFVTLKRQEIWVAIYEAPVARLELHIYPHGPEWRLYGVPATSVASGALERTVLAQPLARCVVGADAEDLLSVSGWEVAIPNTQHLEVKIKGMGEKVPSWEARLGLQGKHRDKVVWSKLRLEGKGIQDFEGEYRLLDKCGTAAGALHIRETDDETAPPLYLFFAPSRGGSFDNDGFVIAKTTRRLEYGETRPVEMRLSAKWRPKSVEEEAVKCTVGEKWAPAPLKIKPASSKGATVRASSKAIEFTLEADSCAHAHALLVCDVPLGPNPDLVWPRNKWVEVDKVHERGTYRAVTWLTERVRDLDHLSKWRALNTVDGADHQNCERCAPTPPAILWFKHNRRFYAIEDKQQAGPYEQALKNRPSPFVTQLRYDEESKMGTFQIGVNIATLAHRALANLPTEGRTNPVQLSYRLTTNFVPPVKLNLPAFVLKSNRSDPQNAQPKQFKTPLRPEQLRSLHWMLAQERDPPAFVEEEIAEALLEPLGWRAEGKAERKVDVRGGVLADEVGYGKTAITLALIASTLEKPRPVFKPEVVDGGIRTNATLTVVPPHLVLQWPSEVEKFAPKAFKTVIIKDQKDLNGLTIQDIIDADIVIAASGLFKGGKHLENLTAFAGVRDLPNADGRHFNVNLEEALEKVKEQVKRLQKDGAKAVWDEMVKAIEKADEEMNLVLKKRLKGKQYRENAAGVRSPSPSPPPSSPVSSVAPPSSAPSSPPPQPPAKMKSSGKMVMEVVLPIKSATAKTAVQVENTDESDKPRRTASRNPLIIPDSDSEDEEDVKSKRAGPSKSKGKPSTKAKINKAKRKATSDDEDFEAENNDWSESEPESDGAASESDDVEVIDLSEEDEKPKPKEGIG
ncbi:hypothetical protein FS749_000648 [Ceratobasidium sp. UAMH 11750]|nr:hypothetical protein FS749_000648 [Ceratobasidium sp. UAMH 11750]